MVLPHVEMDDTVHVPPLCGFGQINALAELNLSFKRIHMLGLRFVRETGLKPAKLRAMFGLSYQEQPNRNIGYYVGAVLFGFSHQKSGCKCCAAAKQGRILVAAPIIFPIIFGRTEVQGDSHRIAEATPRYTFSTLAVALMSSPE